MTRTEVVQMVGYSVLGVLSLVSVSILALIIGSL
jgi:hypothetical protein